MILELQIRKNLHQPVQAFFVYRGIGKSHRFGIDKSYRNEYN